MGRATGGAGAAVAFGRSALAACAEATCRRRATPNTASPSTINMPNRNIAFVFQGLSALAIHAAASTIPMVFLNVADPVGLGLVKSLAHPGGNVTGFATFVPEGIIGKHLQLLKELVPQASRIAVLVNPTEKMHQLALHGFVKVALDTIARVITRRTEPQVKLH